MPTERISNIVENGRRRSGTGTEKVTQVVVTLPEGVQSGAPELSPSNSRRCGMCNQGRLGAADVPRSPGSDRLDTRRRSLHWGLTMASTEIDRGRGLPASPAPQPGQHIGERPIAMV